MSRKISDTGALETAGPRQFLGQALLEVPTVEALRRVVLDHQFAHREDAAGRGRRPGSVQLQQPLDPLRTLGRRPSSSSSTHHRPTVPLGLTSGEGRVEGSDLRATRRSPSRRAQTLEDDRPFRREPVLRVGRVDRREGLETGIFLGSGGRGERDQRASALARRPSATPQRRAAPGGALSSRTAGRAR